MKKPGSGKTREWVKNDVTQWFLEKLALYMNEIDTVRDINLNNIDVALARRLAIEVIENAFGDILEAGELQIFQKKVAESESNTIKTLKDLPKSEY